MDAKYGREDTSTDVLIIGGGIAGLTAAVSIKERAPDIDVLIVEKQTCGYSGKANKGGGVLQYFDLTKIDPMEFVAYHANNVGCFLGDQELMLKYVSMNNLMLDKLAEWGARLPRNYDGSWNVIPTGPMTAMIGVDLDVTLKVRRTAERMGVRIMDKTAVSDLLTTGGGIEGDGAEGGGIAGGGVAVGRIAVDGVDGGVTAGGKVKGGPVSGVRIAGAAAFSILDGKFYTFRARAVVLASGSQNYRIGAMWGSGRGDGIAAAYRAGAELRNAEFGNFAQLVKIRSHGEVVFGENFMYNDRGEHVTKNFREYRESDISSTAIREWYTQMLSGSPIHLEIEDEGGSMAELFDRPYGAAFWRLNHERASAVDSDMEVCPMFIGEQSPVKVGHDMQTTIPGLFAVGDVSYCGSCAPGAVPAPPGRNRGSGILNAVFAGILCADSAAALGGGAAAIMGHEAAGAAAITGQGDARHVGAASGSKSAGPETAAEKADSGTSPASLASLPEIDEARVALCIERLYAPLERSDGNAAEDVIREVQKAVGPMENSVYMSGERIAAALKHVDRAVELATTLKAADFHELLSCHEAEAMALCAQMQFRASEIRKESRGWFLREDYPETDNANWLKWIIVKNDGGKMAFETENVPYEKWPIKPGALHAIQ